MYWYNGSLIQGTDLCLPITDPGLLYGATVFTTLRIYDGTLTHPLTVWPAHRDRLHLSVEDLGWVPPDWARLEHGATMLASQFPVLRITMFPDGREWITGRSLPPALSEFQQEGITAWIAEPMHHYGRSLPHLKTGNYLAPWQARQKAAQHNAQEAILVNAQGDWLETSTGTLWGWGKGAWWTPPLAAGLLPGIARSHLIPRLRCQNEEVREDPWSNAVVANLEAIAYTNAVVQVIPIHTVLSVDNPYTFNPKHPALERLKVQFQAPLRPDF